jgi:hypothetical protein
MNNRKQLPMALLYGIAILWVVLTALACLTTFDNRTSSEVMANGH